MAMEKMLAAGCSARRLSGRSGAGRRAGRRKVLCYKQVGGLPPLLWMKLIPRGRNSVGRFRWLVVGLLASAGASLLTLTSMLNAAFAFGDEEGSIALIMGGTGLGGGTLPSGMPTDDFVTDVISRYIDPAEPFFSGQPVFSGFTPVPLATPEQDAPSVGTLTIGQSEARASPI